MGLIMLNSQEYGGIQSPATLTDLGLVKPDGITLNVDENGVISGYIDQTLLSKLSGIEYGAQVNTVTGIKGDNEEAYRIGQVNITPDNIGAVSSYEKGSANGVVPLNETSLIDAKYLPSYVDDVLEFESKDSFPKEGEAGKIYVDISAEDNNTYRWSGTTYILIAKNTNTTYKLAQSGSTITLTGNDGSSTTVHGAGSASDLPYDNSASGLTAEDVNSAIDEIAKKGASTSAAAVTYDSSTSTLSASNVQAAIDELKTLIDSMRSILDTALIVESGNTTAAASESNEIPSSSGNSEDSTNQ